MSSERTTRLEVPSHGSVSGVWALPGNGHSSWTFIYAPGAGASIKDGFGIFAADRLAASGVATLRFQFPYTEAGRRMVDRPPVLEATWRAAILAAREASPGLVVGGRSMGGRIASQVVAQGEGVDGLALFAYPLHPPGQPDRLRTSHLPQITVPALFCSGTNDAFATPEELQQASTLVPRAQVYMLTGADHSFRIARVTGRRQKDVWDEAVTVFIDWLGSIGPASG